MPAALARRRANGETANLQVPVVADAGQWAGLYATPSPTTSSDTASPSGATSSSATSSSGASPSS